MRKAILILTLAVGLFSCSKSEDPAPEQEQVNLTGTTWISPGEKYAGNGLTYYKHARFVSNTKVDLFDSYLVGEETDDYTSHGDYKITGDKITVTGFGHFGMAINQEYIYKGGELSLNGVKYTKIK
jgi:hypothetical protein